MKRTILPANCLFAWGKLNGVTFDRVELEAEIMTADGVLKGAGLVSTCDRDGEEGDSTLVSVPSDLVLGQDQVHRYAITDPQLKSVLDVSDAQGEFGRVSALLTVYSSSIRMTLQSRWCLYG